MAELLGMDRSYLVRERQEGPSLHVLKTIADGFKVSLSQLLRGL